MNQLPRLATFGRSFDVLGVFMGCVGQASASLYMIFATREAFASLARYEEVPQATFFQSSLALLVAIGCLNLAKWRATSLGESYSKALQQSVNLTSLGAARTGLVVRDQASLSVFGVGDVAATQQWFGRGLLYVVTALVLIPLALGALVYVEPRLAGASLPVVLLALATSLGVALMLRLKFLARSAHRICLKSILNIGILAACFLVLWRAGQTGVVLDAVLASLAILLCLIFPLQNLVAAWELFCDWRRTRDKTVGLLQQFSAKSSAPAPQEPLLQELSPQDRLSPEPADQERLRQENPRRELCTSPGAVSVGISGRIDGLSVAQTFPKGKLTRLKGDAASDVARAVAGLSRPKSAVVCFDGALTQPLTAYIGPRYAGSQAPEGDDHRVNPAHLVASAAVDLATLRQALERYHLQSLATADRLKDRDMVQIQRSLTAENRFRFDLMCAELAEVSLLVVDWFDFQSLSVKDDLLTQFNNRCAATILVVSSP